MRRGVALALVLATHAARAQPSQELTKEFQAGVDAFRLGKYDDARAHLERARKLDPTLPGPYRFLAAVAKAQQRWPDCMDAARHALVLNPHSSEAPETRQIYADCRAAAGRMPYQGPELGDSAAISVVANAPAATVKINGLPYGGTPMAPRPITAGKLAIDVDKRGWKPAHVEVDAPAGIVTDVDIELEPDTSQQAAPELATKSAEAPTKGWLVLPGERLELDPGTHVIERRAPGADLWRRRVRIIAGQETRVVPQFVNTAAREHREHVGFAVLAGSGALVAAGFGFALASEDAANEARDIVRVETARDPSQPLSSTATVEPVRTRADFDHEVARADRDAVISDIAYGAGLAALGVAAYYLYIGARARTDVPPPFAIAPTRGGALVAKELAW